MKLRHLCTQKCGDIRTLYNACKLQGFVLISYYDGRAGNYAKAALNGALLNGRPLRIEPTTPGQKVYDKDIQSGMNCKHQLIIDPAWTCSFCRMRTWHPWRFG